MHSMSLCPVTGPNGPRNGARVVARAWADPGYKARLLADATSAIAEFGYSSNQGDRMLVVENTPKVHNVIVCTLCSRYPWPVLGLPPVWYKSAAYRSRVVIDLRGVLREFGLELGKMWECEYGTARRSCAIWCCRSAPQARKT